MTLEPMDIVAMDIVGKLPLTENGNQYLLVFSDYLSRWTEAFPIPDQRSGTIAKVFVEEIVYRYGVPGTLLTDNGSNFVGILFQQICKLLGIKRLLTTPYHPQTDGLVERFNGTLLGMLRPFVGDTQRDWDTFLKPVLFAYRTAVQKSIKTSPFFLMYGRLPTLPFDDILTPSHSPSYNDNPSMAEEVSSQLRTAFRAAQSYLKEAAKKQSQHRTKKEASVDIGVGSHVLLRNEVIPVGHSRKLVPKWIGPYVILERKSPVNFVIKDIQDDRKPNKLVHADRLKRIDYEPFPPRKDSVEYQAPPSFTKAVEKGEPSTSDLEQEIGRFNEPSIVYQPKERRRPGATTRSMGRPTLEPPWVQRVVLEHRQKPTKVLQQRGGARMNPPRVARGRRRLQSDP